MTTNDCGYIRPLLLAATVAFAALAVALGACSQGERGSSDGRAERAATVERPDAAPTSPKREPAAGPPVRLQLPAGVQLERSARTQLARASQRFAVTLVRWLYGDRREMNIEPIAAEVRRELASAPPYVPAGQIGSADGQAIGVRVFVQTPRSGVLVLAIRDSRTTYSIPATFELERDRWEVVGLNTD